MEHNHDNHRPSLVEGKKDFERKKKKRAGGFQNAIYEKVLYTRAGSSHTLILKEKAKE